MTNSVLELCEAELELGVEAAICDPKNRSGGSKVKFRRRTVQTQPWRYASQKDVVNAFSSESPPCFRKLKHTVFMAHGTPEYCFLVEVVKGTPALTTSIGLIREYDATVCWTPFEAEYWQIIYPDKPIYALTHGVDLQYWSPAEPETPFKSHPTVVSADVGRLGKLPFTLLFAVKKAQEKLSELKLNLMGIFKDQQATMLLLIHKLNLELDIPVMVVGLLPNIREVYRAADMVFSCAENGLMSRVAIEALACGCPTIVLEGQSCLAATTKCKNNIGSMADAIVKLWSVIKEDPEKARTDARRLAEEHYDVKETAKQFIHIAEGLT